MRDFDLTQANSVIPLGHHQGQLKCLNRAFQPFFGKLIFQLPNLLFLLLMHILLRELFVQMSEGSVLPNLFPQTIDGYTLILPLLQQERVELLILHIILYYASFEIL
jgi:hypothetical protein